MIKYQYRGEVIATYPTKNGKHMVSLWNYDETKLPVTGVFSPLDPEALPEKGEGIYMVVIEKTHTIITPLKIYRKEKGN